MAFVVGCAGVPIAPVGTPRSPQGGTVSYRVSLPSHADGEVRVEACVFDLGSSDWAPLAGTRAAPREMRRTSEGCVAYSILPSASRGPFPVSATPEAFVGGDATVFLRPSPPSREATIEVRIDAPPGVRFSTAWPIDDEGVARPGRSFLSRESHFAFGRGLRHARFESAGTTVDRALLPGALAVTEAELDEWIGESMRAVSTLAGRFPRQHVQVVVLPVGAGDPVPLGLVRRGGGASVLLLVAEDASLDVLLRDWVAVHELTHLVFPLVHRGDAWLSEGLSTYYQEVLRARGGLIAPRDAWRRFVAGFERGRRAPGSLPIGLESDQMMANRNFHRVYWSGAAFALLADLALRARGTSLDALVTAREDTLVASHTTWRATELLAFLEAPLGAPVLTERAAALEASADFPDVSVALESLGIAVDDAGEVAFSESADAVALRTAIMGGD